jgi:Protein of unknown function (DUF1571)
MPVFRLLLCLPVCFLFRPAYPETVWADAPLDAAVADQEPLPDPDPIAFLKKCVDRFDRDNIQGYSCILHKQERINGELQPSEDIELFVRAQPFSVFMHWLRGQRLADSALYVEGQNDGKMLAHPAGLAGALVKVVARDPNGPDAKQSGRYPITDAGLKNGLLRTYKTWKEAQEEGTLHVDYLGVRKVRESNDRLCYTLRRKYEKPAEDGTDEVTVYIDKDNWFQIRSVIRDKEGRLIGDYIFRNIELNPKFKPNQFEPSALTP